MRLFDALRGGSDREARDLERRVRAHRARVPEVVEQLREFAGMASLGADRMRRIHAFTDGIGAMPPEERAAAWIVTVASGVGGNRGTLTWLLYNMIPSRGPAMDPEAIRLLVDLAFTADTAWSTLRIVSMAVGSAEQLSAPERAELEEPLRRAFDWLGTAQGQPSDQAKVRTRIRRLLGADGPTPLDVSIFHDQDGWGPAAREAAAGAATDPQAAEEIQALLEHLGSLRAPVPSGKWRDGARALSTPATRPLLVSLIDLLLTAQPGRRQVYTFTLDVIVGGMNADLARGVIWAGALTGDAEALAGVIRIAERAAARIGNTVYDGEKIANASARALGAAGTPEALAALARLRATVKHQGLLKHVSAALVDAAAGAGVTPSALLELAVSDAGLDGSGQREVEADAGWTAILTLGVRGTVATAWRSAYGAVGRTKPPGLSREAALRVERARQEILEAARAERHRLEEILAEDRSWTFEEWRERYRDHPLTGRFARALVWRVDPGTGPGFVGLPQDEGFADVDGQPREVTPGARIAPWHPIAAAPGEVAGWRRRILDAHVRQPFKQVFREVYLVAPAEEETEVYSNRFAGHVLRYQQLFALLKDRRWKTKYLGPWDTGWDGQATRTFEGHGLLASFVFDPILEEDQRGSFEHCTTDQVRFWAIPGREQSRLRLADVPPIVFSEAMRDVDLFVSVCSIALDPTWADRGEDRLQAQWLERAQGELQESGKVRRDVLAWLVPQLKIADRCSVEGRWLVVQGTLSRYRIHLGSGNVLMEPSGRYLCIVRSRFRTAELQLPFEEDGLLALILSKAFMLADDRTIRDTTILRQIRQARA